MASMDKRPTQQPGDNRPAQQPGPPNPVRLPPLDVKLIDYIEKGGHPPADSAER